MRALPRPNQSEKLIAYNDNRTKHQVGDEVTIPYGHSQFCGSWIYKVTRVNGNEVYGTYLRGDVCEMELEDVM